MAVLIDAENTPARMAQDLLKEVSKYGIPVIKRAYGDFSKPNLVNWKNVAIAHAISTEQQFSYTSGKNSTDIRLVIDAMDILYSPMYDIDDFVVVSSDSDFAPLASRLRTAGKGRVYGAGDSKTPDGFKNSVDQFITLSGITNRRSSAERAVTRSEEEHQELQSLLVEIIEDLSESPESNMFLSGVTEEEDAGDAESGAVYSRAVARVLGRRMADFKADQYTGFARHPGQRIRFTNILESLSDKFALTPKHVGVHTQLMLTPKVESASFSLNSEQHVQPVDAAPTKNEESALKTPDVEPTENEATPGTESTDAVKQEEKEAW